MIAFKKYKFNKIACLFNSLQFRVMIISRIKIANMNSTTISYIPKISNIYFT